MFLLEERILIIQLRSNSTHKAASALAALIRVALSRRRREIFVNVSHTEPIFQLEALAGSLACSIPEKMWYLFLVKLARETCIAVRKPLYHLEFDPVVGGDICQISPSPKTALNLRQRLIRALKAYRCAYNHIFDKL